MDSFAYYKAFAEKRASEQDVEQLVDLAKSGDVNAMNRIARMSISVAIRIADKLSRNCRSLMEEMLCEAMVALPKIVDGYDSSRGLPFFRWCGMKMALAAMYATKNIKRKEARILSESIIDNDILATMAICHDVHVDRTITVMTVSEIVDNLPPRESEVVKRWYGLGRDPMTDTAIGREMGITIDQSLRARQRALKFMREQLERKAAK